MTTTSPMALWAFSRLIRSSSTVICLLILASTLILGSRCLRAGVDMNMIESPMPVTRTLAGLRVGARTGIGDAGAGPAETRCGAGDADVPLAAVDPLLVVAAQPSMATPMTAM